MAAKVTPSTPGAPSFSSASAYALRSVSILQTCTYKPQKRQDVSDFALTYSLRLRSCKSLDAFIISSLPSRLKETLQAAGSLAPGRYSISSLLRPIRHPLAFDRFPGLAGYTIYLAPVISPRDEEGFASYSVCPCYRAVAFTPPRWRCRIGQISAPHAAFALRKQARPSDLRLSRPHLRSLSLQPGNS